MKKMKVTPISLYALIHKKKYKNAGLFREAFEKKMKEHLPQSTLSNYEYTDGQRPSTRRLELMSKFLELTRAEKASLLEYFEGHKKPLRNRKPQAPCKVTKRTKGKNKKPTRRNQKTVYFVGKRTRKPKPSSMPPGMNEAGNFLILCKERAPLLGKKMSDLSILTALFMEANGVKTK